MDKKFNRNKEKHTLKFVINLKSLTLKSSHFMWPTSYT